MKSKVLLAVGMGMLVGWTMPQQAVAQDGDGPGTHVISVTTWTVPYGQRGPFFDFFMNRVWPATQLNPHVINARLMGHLHGSRGDQIVAIVEYADMEGLGAACGQPCTDYFDANPAPEEGDEGYEEFEEGRASFQRWYSRHSDEIYNVPMNSAVSDGEPVGDVGTPDDDGDDD